MRTYNATHAYYGGIDRHARSLFVHVLDDKGVTRLERDIAASPDAVLDALQPFRDGLVVGCECMFAWYWVADLCEREAIPFVLGHALAMKAIHGGKAKNDRLDAAKIAGLLKGGFFPMAYVYPRDKRETREREWTLLGSASGRAFSPPQDLRFHSSRLAMRAGHESGSASPLSLLKLRKPPDV